MLKRLMAFVTRRDGAVGRRAARRIASPRASVYLEYAIVLPLAVLLISTLIEFCALWDAKIMANHTAWTCARIATVEAGQGKYADTVSDNRLRTKGMKTATTLLMSTCSMGSMHGSSTEFTKHWFEEIILSPLKKMQTEFKASLTKQLKKSIGEAIGKVIGEDVASLFVQTVATWIVDAFFSPLIDVLVGVIDDVFGPMFEGIGGLLDGQRQLRQLAYAAGRVAQFDGIVKVTEHDLFPLVFSKMASGWGQDTRLDFPRCLDKTSTRDEWFVKSSAPWPPNDQRQRMIDVKIAWPFERAWMFPVLSVQKLPEEEAKSLEGMPTAVGRALFYPQPLILNDNLKSKGATPFAPGKAPKIPDFLKKIMERFLNFLKVASLYYKYQLTDEEVGPYDSNKDANYSYKGIGVGVEKGPERDKIYTCDGLVKWMERAPNDPEKQGNWDAKPPPADYFKCWLEIDQPRSRMYKGNNKERVKFWWGLPFRAAKSDELLHLCNHDYRGKEWFFWGDDKQRHLRQKHKQPNEHKDLLKTESARRGFLTGEDELCWGVSQAEYEAQARAEGGEVVPYALYAMLRDQAPDLFGSRTRTMIATWCPGQFASCEAEERATAKRFATMDDCQRIYDETRKLIKDCSTELENAVGGKGKGGDPGDPEGFVKVEGLDEAIMKNPKKAAEIIDQKLAEMKAKVFPAIKKVDECEQRLRDLDEKMPKKAAELAAMRQADLRRFAVAVGRALLDNELQMIPSAVHAKLLAKHPWTGDGPVAVTRQLKALRDDYYVALVNLYNAELELGKALGCKSAQRPPLNPEDPTPPFKPVDPDPDFPKPSSPDSGSDNDQGGDSWTHGDKGWTNDKGGKDV